MKLTNNKAALHVLTALGVVTLILAGCAAPPEENSTTTQASSDDNSDFIACMVAGMGGFDDHSYNELSKAALDKAGAELGIETKAVRSTTEDDYSPNITSMVNEGCHLIITIGFPLSEATIEAGIANPDMNFAIVDDTLDADFDGVSDITNGKPLLFNTAEAAFLAGYAAAAYSTAGIVGTYGGLQSNPVTIFMDGFVDGVAYYNQENGASVSAIGWDKESQTGSFTGAFVAGVESKTLAQNLIDQGADVILPVGGAIYKSAVEAIREADREIALIGVDADVYDTDPTIRDLLLTSILKAIDVAVDDVIVNSFNGNFSGSPYVGNLGNDGVGIAPFHDFESKVPADLAEKLGELRESIISGQVQVFSQATPQ